MDDDGNNPQHTKMREAADRRRQKLQKSKEAKKGLKTAPATQMADFSLCSISPYQPEVEDVKKMEVVINGVPYCSNQLIFNDEKPKKYFMLDRSHPCCMRLTNMNEHDNGAMEFFSSLYHFSQITHSKFIIRALRLDNADDCAKVFFFADEILEMIPVALQQRYAWNEKAKNSHAVLTQYWHRDETHLCRIIPKLEFKKVIKDFGIDQSQITIIRDPVHDHTTHETLHKALAPIYSLSPDGKEVMTPEQAYFYLFQSVICGIDWNTEKCRENEQALASFQAMYLFDVTETTLMLDDQEVLITKEFVDQQIDSLKSHRIFTENIVHQTTDYLLESYKFDDSIPLKLHKKIWKDLGFRHVPIEMDEILVWMSRPLVIFYSIQSFYYEDLVMRKEQLVVELCKKIVDRMRTPQKCAMLVEIQTALKQGKPTAEHLNGHTAFASNFPSNCPERQQGRPTYCLQSPDEVEEIFKNLGFDKKREKSKMTGEKRETEAVGQVVTKPMDKETLKPKDSEEQVQEQNRPTEKMIPQARKQKQEPLNGDTPSTSSFPSDSSEPKRSPLMFQFDTCPKSGKRRVKAMQESDLRDDPQHILMRAIFENGKKELAKTLEKEKMRMWGPGEAKKSEKENLVQKEPKDVTTPEPSKPQTLEMKNEEPKTLEPPFDASNGQPSSFCESAEKSPAPSEPQPNPRPVLKAVRTKTSMSSETESAQCDPAEPCEKCIETQELLKKAEEQAKQAHSEALRQSSYNRGAIARIRELEKELELAKKPNEEQSEELDLVKKTNEEQAKELVKLKERMAKATATIENMKGENKNLRQQNEKLKGEVGSKNQELLNAQEEVSQLDQKVEDVQLNLALNQSQMDKETEENLAMIAELQRKVQELSLRSAPSTSSGASSPMTTIEEWLKFKDDFVEKRLVNEAKCETERLKDLTTDPKIKDLCVFELSQFEISANIYIDVINLNISKLQKGYAPTELLSLPGLPILSKKFRLEYLKAMREQSKQAAAQAQAAAAAPQVVPETGFDPKVECYICTRKFERGDKVWTCNQCTVPTCIGCHLKWKKAQKESLNVNEACGYCRIILEEQNQKKRR